MKPIYSNITTLADFHTLIQFWERIKFEGLVFKRYETLSNRIRAEICEKLDLGKVLPREAALHDLQAIIDHPPGHIDTNIETYSLHFTRRKHPEYGIDDLVTCCLFIRKEGLPVFLVFIDNEWVILIDEKTLK